MRALALEARGIAQEGGAQSAYTETVLGTSGLMAYWPAQESAVPLDDRVGANELVSDGTYPTDATFGDPGPLGGKALTFPLVLGTTGIRTPDPIDTAFAFAPAAPFCVEFLAKYVPFGTTLAVQGALVQKGFSMGAGGTKWQWEITARRSGSAWFLGLARYDSAGSGDNCTTSDLTVPDTWARYECEYDGTNMRIRRNDVVIGGPSASARNITAQASPVVIGGDHGVSGLHPVSPRGWSLAHIAIYNRVLTAPERAAHQAVTGF